ncbi:hypothetical protein TGAM01_v208406 [Trichoderma gamsii]|uniref:Uncharacterized protein n=1 Tax=Trichoderma gamsii TaxID=398673 RepID=A0A2P4ZEK3_9HYPO|nr:hypothetical protein TGAM01_v208406 [Trichoderma gamsii]PON22720.1 hypothetical protein TGAM01_v208406 [Trichoderma gamsii]
MPRVRARDMQVPYEIAWIVPSDEAFVAGHRVLQTDAAIGVWTDDVPTDSSTGPRQYPYTHTEVNSHAAYPTNAGYKGNIPRLAEVMVEALNNNGLQLRMCMVSDLGHFTTVPNGVYLGFNHCVVDCYNVEGRLSVSVRKESIRNAKSLLTVVRNLVISQDTSSDCIYKAFPAYDYSDPSLEPYICRAPPFKDLPCLKFTGLCHRSDVSQQPVDHSYEVAAWHVCSVLQHLPTLEATVPDPRRRER